MDKIDNTVIAKSVTSRRSKIFTTISLGISLFYVVFNGFMALSVKSIWYGALTGYYLLLVFLRGGILFGNSKYAQKMDNQSIYKMQLRKLKIYRLSGCALLDIIVAMSFAVAQMVEGEKSYEYVGFAIYASALYTFIKVIIAIVNFVKAKKKSDISLEALRHINLADALVSLLALQSAMFKAFSPGIYKGIANACTGAAVCSFILALGIYMIIKSTKKIKRMKISYEL